MTINLKEGYYRVKHTHSNNEIITYSVSLLLLAWFTFQTVRLSVYKYFCIDEFQYAHASWLISKGYVPYRDFFDHHFPLIYQILSLPFIYLGNNPANILYLRVMINIFVLIVIIAVYIINAKSNRLSGVIASLLLLAVWNFSSKATEIRPDIVAFSFFILAIALLYSGKKSSLKGFLVGVLVTCSLWGSQKFIYYGVVFLIAFVIDIIWNRRHGQGEYLMGKPVMVILGCLSTLVPIALYLTITQSWSEWFFWCIKWAFIHEREYQGFSWTRYFNPFWLDYWWLFPFALVGLVYTILFILKESHYPWTDPDVVLIGSLFTTFISYAIQTGPFSYSLIPFIAIVAIFAGRGVAYALRSSWERREANRTLSLSLYVFICLFLLLALFNANLEIEALIKSDNVYQYKILSEINDLTSPNDTVYDNSGGYVTRPNVYYYFYTDSLLRHKLKDYMAGQVPYEIMKSKCVMVLQDLRFQELPASLKKFIQDHYQPYNGDIRLWGQHYRMPLSQSLKSVFLAIKKGKYFIQPESILNEGELYIDGRRISKPCFELAAGAREIRYAGKAKEFFLLWLPKNNQTYQPRFDLPAHFSKLL